MKPLVVANWKMNPSTTDEAIKLVEGIKDKDNFVICPPFVFLPLFKGVKKGAQNLFWEKEGAFTGEISPLMLKDLGCEYVIVGHSERRGYFEETDEMVNKKVKAALENSLIPIVCIGEKEGEKVEEILRREIEEGLKGIDISSVIIAYEPIWAIGTGKACDLNKALERKNLILNILKEAFNFSDIPVLYGGSVKSHNASGFIKEADFQGLLVGGASLDPEEFSKIIDSVV